MAAIYLLTCNFGKNYVGVSTQPKRRIQAHLSGNGSRLIKEALNLGASFMSSTLYENEDVFELYSQEPLFIEKYNCLSPMGYNLDLGGRQGGVSSRLGSKNTQAVLNEELVLEIRESYASSDKITQEILAGRYGVSRETISALVRGKSWTEVGGPITVKRNIDIKTPEEVIHNIRELRRSTKLTYDQIAEQLGVTRSVAAKYGKGVR